MQENENKEIIESEIRGLWVETPQGKNILIKLSEESQKVLFNG